MEQAKADSPVAQTTGLVGMGVDDLGGVHWLVCHLVALEALDLGPHLLVVQRELVDQEEDVHDHLCLHLQELGPLGPCHHLQDPGPYRHLQEPGPCHYLLGLMTEDLQVPLGLVVFSMFSYLFFLLEPQCI